MAYLTKSCGCEFDVDVYVSNGCCCGECYYSYYSNSYDVEDVEIIKLCDEHNKF